MAKTKEETAGAAGEIPLSLAEFCTRLSGVDQRVELIGGFHSQEEAAGRTNDTESAYKARFVEFTTQPA